jgi:gluconolactonase
MLAVLLLPVSGFAQITGASGLVADGAELRRVATGFAFTEGPAARRNGSVFFTDQPNNRILLWEPDGTVSVYLEEAGRANGLYVDDEGSLLACADENGQLWRISPAKEIEVLLSDPDGRQLNGPNDLWLSADGGIYFTDPFYQRDYWTRTEPDFDTQNVFYLAPDGTLSVVEDGLVKPNGIIGSGDGKTLYVADYGGDKTYAYRRNEDGMLTERREFAAMGSDGMTTDEQGNVYLTGDGVTIFSASGERIGHIAIDEDWTANVTFGGANHDILFITASKAIYTLPMKVRGVRW